MKTTLYIGYLQDTLEHNLFKRSFFSPQNFITSTIPQIFLILAYYNVEVDTLIIKHFALHLS